MKITILGAGVVGVTSAYFLGARGHEVEVIEREPESACQTSFANGGQLSYSHAEPWANPHTLPMVFKWMFKKDAPLVMRFSTDPHMIAWGLKFLANCTAARAEANSVSTLRLGLYSKKKMEQLRSLTGIKFDNVREGILHVFTSKSSFDAAIRQSHFQEKLGCKEDILDVNACLRMEPTLEQTERTLVGGIHAPLDESGDICTFTRELAKLCEKEFGTVFHYGTNVTGIKAEGGKITGVETDKGNFTADAYVMSLGSFSPVFLRKIGIRVPIYPMKGYSITLPANIHAPKVSITDGEHKLVYSRLGDRLRIAGTAEFARYDMKVYEHRIQPIIRAAKTLFPKCEWDKDISRWACLRPSTPDGPPIIGKTKYSNFYMNTGHGTLGWTQAAGSGVLLADVMENRPTEISLEGLSIDRYL